MSEVQNLRNRILKAGNRHGCPLWKDASDIGSNSIGVPEHGFAIYYSSRAGGVFKLDDLTDTIHIPDLGTTERLKLSRWIYDQNRIGQIPFITAKEIERIESEQPLRIEERMVRLLECYENLPDSMSNGLIVSGPVDTRSVDELNSILAATECETIKDREWLEDAAIAEGWLESGQVGNTMQYVRLTPAGVKRLEDLTLDSARSSQAFVAMWFSEEMQKVYDHAIAPAVVESGYRAYKVDLDESFDQQITDQIFFQVKRSRFLIADFSHDSSGVRGGVYFEAGYAKGLGLPIIWCIRKDGVSNMHFDTDHFPHIIWENADDLKAQLTSKILGFVGPGPLT